MERTLSAFAALLLVSLVSACGGSSDDAPNTTASARTAASTAPPVPTSQRFLSQPWSETEGAPPQR
jgi:hypothetical protein